MPAISPPVSELEKEIFTETTFETVLDREIVPQVSAALRVAWPLFHLNDREDFAEIGRGPKKGEELRKKTTDIMRTGLVSERV